MHGPQSILEKIKMLPSPTTIDLVQEMVTVVLARKHASNGGAHAALEAVLMEKGTHAQAIVEQMGV